MNALKINGFLMLLIILSVGNLFAQTDNKEVTITSIGSGATMEDAKQAALRSAIEQAFGVFISSKTEILNDSILADQIVSVSSGNIKSFDILNQDQLLDGRWSVTIKSIVSVDKLTSFVKAKGIEVEIKGGMFALNIKQQLLNEQGEIQAIAEMVGVLHEAMQTSFDYDILASDPKSLDAESVNWEIPIKVTTTCNKNIDFCANYFEKTLAALSLSQEEIESYKQLNKQVYLVRYYNNSFYLRREKSIKAIGQLLYNWNFYLHNFTVQSTLGEINGNSFENSLETNLETVKLGRLTDTVITFNLPWSNNKVGAFTYKDKRTLKEVEQITGFSVKPKGLVSSFKYGGYVIYEKDGHGIVVSLFDIGYELWDDAKIKCAELVLNGFNDWNLPSKDDFKLIDENLYYYEMGYFGDEWSYYWSNSEVNQTSEAWVYNFTKKRFLQQSKYSRKAFVRAVRYF